MFYRSGWLRCVGFKCIGLGLSWCSFMFRAGLTLGVTLYCIIYYIIHIHIHILLLYYTLLLLYIIYYIILSSSPYLLFFLSSFPFKSSSSPYSHLLPFSSSIPSVPLLLISSFPSILSSFPSLPLPSSLLPFPSFILYVSVFIVGYLYLLDVYVLFSSVLLFSPSPIFLSHLSIQSIRVGIWIHLFIFQTHPRII